MMFGYDLTYTLLVVLPMGLIAITVHEVSHGYVAYLLGDPTAHNAGRLTLNPVPHFDPIGTLMILFVGFGWAKPVPVNPAYFREPQKGMMYTALAGPASNLILAILFGLLLKASLFLPEGVVEPVVRFVSFGIMINIILMAFNLIPIPPLDGSRVMAYLLPPDLSMRYQELERYGLIPVLLVVFVLPWLTGFNIVSFIANGALSVFYRVLF